MRITDSWVKSKHSELRGTHADTARLSVFFMELVRDLALNNLAEFSFEDLGKRFKRPDLAAYYAMFAVTVDEDQICCRIDFTRRIVSYWTEPNHGGGRILVTP